ncbi:MAG: HD domain-containing protein [Bacteroidota bacterium]
MTFAEATDILHRMVQSPSLRRHCLSISLVMRHYAEKYGEDPEEWAIAGLLHDADYEQYPDQHPQVIVDQLREAGEEKIAHAISAHYTKWGVSYDTTLDKALLACDELTGFIIAVALVRPTRIEGMKPKSVRKKLKDKKFAAKVERDEIEKGVELLGVDPNEHIAFIISILNQYQDELTLGPI